MKIGTIYGLTPLVNETVCGEEFFEAAKATGHYVELDAAIDRFCRNALGINPREVTLDDATSTLHQMRDVEYYQIWASRYGFTPGLSVLDLIFNMGPEAPLVLKAMQP